MGKSILVAGVLIIGIVIILFLPVQSDNKKDSEDVFSLAGKSPTPSSDSKKNAQNKSDKPTVSVSSAQVKAEKAVIKTSKGDIEISFYNTDSPKTVENFLKKAQSGFYNNLKFHRVEDWVIQGGDPKGNGTGGGNMPTELNKKPFKIGSVGVARGPDIKVSNDSQFFITKSDASYLNEQYANFAEVIRGMYVVNKIQIGDKILEITLE